MMTAAEANRYASIAQKANYKKLQKKIQECANHGYCFMIWNEFTDGKICSSNHPEEVVDRFKPLGYRVFYTFSHHEDCYIFKIEW